MVEYDIFCVANGMKPDVPQLTPAVHTEALTTPAVSFIEAYLKEEIGASDLSQLLDEHPAKCAGQALHTMIKLCAASGEAITEEQASAYPAPLDLRSVRSFEDPSYVHEGYGISTSIYRSAVMKGMWALSSSEFLRGELKHPRKAGAMKLRAAPSGW